MKSRILITAMMLPILFGCTSYVVERGAATANVRSLVPKQSSRPIYYDRIFIFAAEGKCGSDSERKVLFEKSFSKSESSPDGYVKVAANRPIRLKYVDITGDKCAGELEVSLEEGKSYSLEGGPYYREKTGKWGCFFGVVDDETQQDVPETQCP